MAGRESIIGTMMIAMALAAGQGCSGGAMRTLTLEDVRLCTATVYEDDFSRDTGAWLVEGTNAVTLGDGRLSMDAACGAPHLATVWCRREFEGDAVIEYTVRIEPTLNAEGHGETNMNFFLYASDPSGAPLEATSASRTGSYQEYHALNNYILTYLNSDQNERSPIHGEHGPLFTRVRFRKDPGFGLLKEVWLEPTIEKGRDYHFAIVVQGPRMRVYVDGAKIVDVSDGNHPYRRGLHGFRTWMSHLTATSFRVSRIVE